MHRHWGWGEEELQEKSQNKAWGAPHITSPHCVFPPATGSQAFRKDSIVKVCVSIQGTPCHVISLRNSLLHNHRIIAKCFCSDTVQVHLGMPHICAPSCWSPWRVLRTASHPHVPRGWRRRSRVTARIAGPQPGQLWTEI